MKPGQFRDMTVEELQREAAQLEQALFKLRLQKAIGQLEKPHKLRETRRDLARALTILRQKSAPAGEVE